MYALTAVSLIVGIFAAVTAWSNNPEDVLKEARYNTGRLDNFERQIAAPTAVTVTNPPNKPVPVDGKPQ